ncbi:transmembrane 4 L6 family member 1 isoform X1 [Chrysemys picta bellii]|uniref:transmembrane 4 L6 family member 1 isoform X1 n=1 Tax=Chrysemys picta bellii TaxID=8478 RepID=UPI0032B2B82B
MSRNTADYLHVLIEALKLSFSVTFWFCADHDKAPVPTKELLSKMYAKRCLGVVNLQRFASEHQLSKYVTCLHGIIGGGILIFLPAAVFIGLEHDNCCGCCGHENCGKSCAMLSSVLAAFIGILGSGYCFIISALGLSHGPYCLSAVEQNWVYPFTNASGGYLLEHDRWSECREPRNIVEWNLTLFSILLVFGGIELILCSIQVINGFLGGICGVCCNREEKYVC